MMTKMEAHTGTPNLSVHPSGHDENCGGSPRSFHRLPGRFSQSGQELVEFAIIVPLFILFLFGIYDLGRAFYAVVVITNAAREGARYGVVHTGMGTPYSYGLYMANIVDYTRSEALNSGVNLIASPVTVTCPRDTKGDTDPSNDTCQSRQPIRVTISYHFTFFMSNILPRASLDIVRYAEMMIP
ncbi:MAG TPA: TadE/TadG family type IV pilus assembly protein [Anaerolineales bacterium]